MSELHATFLGTATSVGVPMIGCDCPTCTSDDPRDTRLRSSLYMKLGSKQWVIDTGPDFRAQCLRENITELDAVLYTHQHTDHVAGFDELRRFTIGADQSIPIYANPGCMATLQQMFAFAFNGENRYIGYIKPDPHIIQGPFQLADLPELTITPLPVEHGKVETHGYLFTVAGQKQNPQNQKRLAYLSDVKRIPELTLSLLQGVDTLVLDCLKDTPHPTHMNFEESMATIAQLQPRQTYLTHFMCAMHHAELETRCPAGVQPAYDGLSISV